MFRTKSNTSACSFGGNALICSMISNALITAKTTPNRLKCQVRTSASGSRNWNLLQPLRRILLLEFLAPAFYFRVVEDLSDDPAQKPLQVWVFQIAQRANRLFFVSLQQRPGAFVRFQFFVKRFDLLHGTGAGKLPAPEAFEQRALFTLGTFIRPRQQQTGTQPKSVIRLTLLAKVAQIVPNLISDA